MVDNSWKFQIEMSVNSNEKVHVGGYGRIIGGPLLIGYLLLFGMTMEGSTFQYHICLDMRIERCN